MQLLSTAQALVPIPLFGRSQDFTRFLTGSGPVWDLLSMFAGGVGGGIPGMDSGENSLMFTPITIDGTARTQMERTFVPTAEILSINATGRVGRTVVHINTVMNFDEQWTPPPPNAGTMPQSGIFHYWRVE